MSNGTPTVSTLAPPPKPPTEVEIARAAAEVEAAALQAPRLRFDAMLADLEASFEEALAHPAETALAAIGVETSTVSLLEQDVAAAAQKCFVEDLSPETVGHALQALLDSEAASERARRLYEAMKERAERREARLRKVLWPIIENWCKQHPPTKGKTTKFPTTLATCVMKRYAEGKLEVVAERKALAAIRAALGAAAAWDVIKVEESVLVGAAREALVAKGVDPAKLDGVRWVPPGDRLEIRSNS